MGLFDRFKRNNDEITEVEFDEFFKYASLNGTAGIMLPPKLQNEYMISYDVKNYNDGSKEVRFRGNRLWIKLFKAKDGKIQAYFDNVKYPPANDKWTIAKKQCQYEIIRKVMSEWTEFCRNKVEKSKKSNKNKPKFNSPKSAFELAEQIANGASILDIDSLYIMWIDWKQDEKSIIDYMNKYFVNDSINYIFDNSGDISLVKEKNKFTIKHIGDSSDIDRTLIAIQKYLEINYQILFLKESDGDTLAFTVLTNKEWERIKEKHTNEINKYFEQIKDDIKIF